MGDIGVGTSNRLIGNRGIPNSDQVFPVAEASPIASPPIGFPFINDVASRLAYVQGLAMPELLAELYSMPADMLGDEQTAAHIGGPRLVVAIRAVRARRRGDNAGSFFISNEAALRAVPFDQHQQLLKFVAGEELTAARSPGRLTFTPVKSPGVEEMQAKQPQRRAVGSSAAPSRSIESRGMLSGREMTMEGPVDPRYSRAQQIIDNLQSMRAKSPFGTPLNTVEGQFLRIVADQIYVRSSHDLGANKTVLMRIAGSLYMSEQQALELETLASQFKPHAEHVVAGERGIGTETELAAAQANAEMAAKIEVLSHAGSSIGGIMAGIIGMFGGTAAEMRSVAQAGSILEAAGYTLKGSASKTALAEIPPSRWVGLGTTGETPMHSIPGKPQIPRGMSHNEMVQEAAAKARLAPNGIDVNPKQPGTDWVDRGPKGQVPNEGWSHTVDKKGKVRVVHNIEGGEWAQHKAFDEHADTAMEARIRGEVRRAYKKFDDRLTAGESKRGQTLRDGTKFDVRLFKPNGLAIFLEVPGFERLGVSAQQHLQQTADSQLASELLKQDGNVTERTLHGVPIRAVVIGGP